jgi:hypothetical protein
MIRRGKTNAGDSWRTDKWILDLVGNSFDPCPLDEGFCQVGNVLFDGLEMDWFYCSLDHNHHVFVNPPYSNPKPWVEKAIQENKKGCFVVMLLKHDSSTKWFALLQEAGAHFLWCSRRLYHQTNRQSTFPSMLAVLP